MLMIRLMVSLPCCVLVVQHTRLWLVPRFHNTLLLAICPTGHTCIAYQHWSASLKTRVLVGPHAFSSAICRSRGGRGHGNYDPPHVGRLGRGLCGGR